MSRPTILIVEDEALILAMMDDEFRNQAFAVIGAMRMDEAIAILESAQAIDVLFTDVRLPGPADAGWHLGAIAGALRPGLPVFYATGYSCVDVPAGIDPSRVFLKPYSVTKVVKTIAEAVAS